LQQACVLQHLLSQQESAEREVALAELSNIVPARITNRYFIGSPVEFRFSLAHLERAEPLNGDGTRRRNRRLIGSGNIPGGCYGEKLAARWREKELRLRVHEQRQTYGAGRTTLSILV
jgi:hypothetical protein